MSVLVSNDRGWLVDACSFINEGFRRCYSVNKGHFRCCFRKEYFDILKPHIENNSLRADLIGASENTDSPAGGKTGIELKIPKKRKRKRSALNQGELDAEVFHKKIRLLVLEGTLSLLEPGHLSGYLTEDLITLPTKQMPSHECQLAALCDMAKQLFEIENSDAPHMQAVNGHADLDSQLDLFSCLTENPDDCAREVQILAILPAPSNSCADAECSRMCCGYLGNEPPPSSPVCKGGTVSPLGGKAACRVALGKDVLKPYIRPNAKCLEMFARSLQPDWTSWGNEVIKFQHHSYFTTESVESPQTTFSNTIDADQQVDSKVKNNTACL
ncbi:Methyltransferase-like protein 4 [Bagarius yarrelli]|uniref:Methyltransferase-like protein 4 n=1 Tax=Bagarius yarrelli TaxID=175774 RepID=A0A556TYS4_BAGYA|nr:Methyltransferase-like protein 4 [Bagarius yarrelli]